MPYSEEDAAFFFGRDREREILIANLRASRLTLVFGQTGSGKSSVLRAGVAHRLRQMAQANRARRGAPGFAVVVFSSWRDDPVIGLANRIKESVAQLFGDKTLDLGPGSRSLVETLQSASEYVGGSLLIILDQFEEYFLYRPQEEGEDSFAIQLSRAINHPDLRVSFMISMREDSLAKLDHFKSRIPTLFDNYVRIEHLDREAARQAIEKPIDTYNQLGSKTVRIEPALVEAVLDQVGVGQVVLGEAGRGFVGDKPGPASADARIETPYLQLVMTRLWDEEQQAGSDVLRLETLNRLGGAEKIVKSHLDGVMRRLPWRDQKVSSDIFNYLVTPEGGKIALSVATLASWAKKKQRVVEKVLGALASGETRILRQIEPPLGQIGATRFEIFHDRLAPAILDWRNRYRRRREQYSRVVWGGIFLAMAGVVSWLSLELSPTRERLDASVELINGAKDTLNADPELSVALAQHAAKVSYSLYNSIAHYSIYYTSDTERALRNAKRVLRDALQRSRVRFTVSGHASGISDIAFSPDGKKLAMASGGTVAVLETGSGKELFTFSGHKGFLKHVVFNRDGKYLATVDAGGKVRMWDAQSGNGLFTIAVDKVAVEQVVFGPDFDYLMTVGDDKSVKVWDGRTGKELFILASHKGRVIYITWSLNGKYLATVGADGMVEVWDTQTGNHLNSLSNEKNRIKHVVFSPDGEYLATVGEDRKVNVLRTQTGKESFAPPAKTRGVNDVVLSVNGRLLAMVDADKTLKVWDTESHKALPPLSGIKDTPSYMAFSPDGESLATLSRGVMVTIWEPETGKELFNLAGHKGPVNRVVFSADGSKVATVSSRTRTVKVSDIGPDQDLRVLHGHKGKVNALAFSHDGKHLATAGMDRVVKVWDTKTGKESFPSLLGHKRPVYGIAFSPDGDYLATASGDRTAKIWKMKTGKESLILSGHMGYVVSVAFSPDGRYLATASSDRTARVWNAETGGELHTLLGHQGTVYRVVFSPDGKKLATTSADATAMVWDSETGKPIFRLVGHKGPVIQVIFSPDGKYLVTRGVGTTVKVWEAETGNNVFDLAGHKKAVNRVVFSAKGKYLATASDDGTAKVWEAKSGKELLTLSGHTGAVKDVAFSPDGKYLATAGEEKIVRVWDTKTGEELFPSFAAHKGAVYRIAFSPDGKYLATAAGGDTSVRLYGPLAPLLNFEKLLTLAGTRITRPLTPGECKTYASIGETARCRAAYLVEKGQNLARHVDTRNVEELMRTAVASFKEAKQLDPNLVLDPETAASRLAARVLINNGAKLAKDGDVKDATASFQKAVALDSSLTLKPEAEARKLAVQELVRKARNSARDGDIDSAVLGLRKAKEIDPSLGINPQEEASKYRAKSLMVQGDRLMREGKTKEAFAAYGEATRLDPNSPDLLNSVCWFGALEGRAKEVLAECDQAVALTRNEPTKHLGYRDSRGLARALTGQVAGAIEDFQAFISSARYRSQTVIDQRKRWIKQLKSTGKFSLSEEERKGLYSQ